MTLNTNALKEKVLELSIRGKLTSRLNSDISSKDLIKKIKEHNDELYDAKKVRKTRIKRKKIDYDILPFELPEKWTWTKLYDITHSKVLNDGDWIVSKDMSDNGKVKLIQLGSIGSMEFLDKDYKHITESKFEELKCTKIKPGYLLINRLFGDKMYCCRLPQINETLITAVDICWIAPQEKFYNINYLMYVINSNFFQNEARKYGKGSTRLRISKGNLININFPFPPLTEQKRIVEKIEELFEIIDNLNEQGEKQLETLENLRGKTLDLAIKGKLVEQDENDEPASELIKKLMSERKNLKKNKKLKKPRGKIKEIDETPFDIPKNWNWLRLGYSSNLIMGQSPKGTTVNDNPDNGIEFHQGKTHYGYKIIKESGQYTSDPKKIAPKNSILISVRAPVGTLNYNDREVCIGRGLASINPLEEINIDYFYYALSTQIEKLKEQSTGTTFKAITSKILMNLLMPIPPLNEQKRIVEKVDSIMKIIDKIEEELEKKYEIVEKLGSV